MLDSLLLLPFALLRLQQNLLLQDDVFDRGAWYVEEALLQLSSYLRSGDSAAAATSQP